MGQLVFDEEMAHAIERMYEIRDARRRRAIVRRTLSAASGERVLDVGCGPGFYCEELLADVGPTGSVVGIDGSPAMLGLAARRCEGAENVELREADATALPPSLPRTLAPRLRAAGFADVEMQAHAFASCEMDHETYGVAVLPGIRSFVPGHDGVSEEEANAWLSEQRELGERGEFFMSSTQFCFAATKQ
jgi:SAM-dependent methyltransferase